MTIASTQRYLVRQAKTPKDVETCLKLRDLCFRKGQAGRDKDRFDAICTHVLVEERSTKMPVASFRLLQMQSGREYEQCYAAQFYHLSGLKEFAKPIADLGRFCIHPDFQDADILRLAWAALTRIVDDKGIEMLIGCSSFSGIEPQKYRHAFEYLRLKYLISPEGPAQDRPGRKSPEIVEFDILPADVPIDLSSALKALPPLLRTYLMMGGRVSDHAVVDRDLNSLHVFTKLLIADIPAVRAKRLRQKIT